MKSGIYCILNTVNGRLYIGSSKSLRRRKQQHWSKLRGGTHTSPHLQYAWNAHGEAAFVFLVLEYCAVEDCYEREDWWVALTRANQKEKGYNVGLVAASPMRGRPRSEAAKAKTSVALMGRKKGPFTAAHKAKLSAARQGRAPWNKGQPMSEKQRLLLIAANTGRIPSAEQRARQSAKMQGRTFSPEAIAKMSAAAMGNQKGRKKDLDGPVV